MPLASYQNWRDNSCFQTQLSVGNNVPQQPTPVASPPIEDTVQEQPQQQVGVRFGKDKDSSNPHILPRCGTIMPKQPSLEEIKQSPLAFRKLWGGQHALAMAH